MKAQEKSAVSSGPAAMVTSTLATGISRMATMKAVNITPQHRPDTQSARPPRRTAANTARPCSTGRMTSSAATVNRLRQKVTSKLRAASRWRVTTPAMDHISVTATISHTALPWVSPPTPDTAFTLAMSALQRCLHAEAGALID